MVSKVICLSAASALATAVIISTMQESNPQYDRQGAGDAIADALVGKIIGRAIARDQQRRASLNDGAQVAPPPQNSLTTGIREAITDFLDKYPAYTNCVLQPPTQLVCFPHVGASKVFATAVLPQKASSMGPGLVDLENNVAIFNSGERVPLLTLAMLRTQAP